jgi:hypothetical protein
MRAARHGVFEENCRDGLTMEADTGSIFFGQRTAFFGQPFVDLCFGDRNQSIQYNPLSG